MRAARALCLLLSLLCTAAQCADLLDEARNAMKDQRLAHAQALLQILLEADPQQEDASYLLAKVLAWQGLYLPSSAAYRALLERSPGNADYMLGLAQVLVWSGKAAEALPLLVTAQELSPSDPDILRLHIQALLALGEAARKEEVLELQARAFNLFPTQQWDLVKIAPATKAAESRVLDELDRSFSAALNDHIGVGCGIDRLSNGRGQWRACSLDVEHRFGTRKVAYASLAQTHRFGMTDQQWLLGLYYPLPYNTTLNLEGNASASANMVPVNSEMASLQLPLTGGWFATGGLRRSEYASSRSQQEFAALEWYFKDYRSAYTLTRTQAQGSTLWGQRFSFSWYYSDTSFVAGNLSLGREVELAPSRLVYFNTRYVGLNGRHQFDPAWAINWAVGSTSQGNAYTRTGLSLGIRRAF